MTSEWLKIIESDKPIYIYGAGSYGKLIYKYLWLLGCANRVKGFIVSDNTSELSLVLSKPVYSFEKKKRVIHDSILILAMKDLYADEVSMDLQRNSISPDIYVGKTEYSHLESLIYEEIQKKPVKRDKLFICCYLGLGYACNCKYIAEQIHKGFPKIDIVCELNSANNVIIPDYIRIVNRETPEFLVEWFTSGIIICNSGFGGYLGKRDEQYIIHTWHGIGPTKKIGVDVHCDRENDDIRRYVEYESSKVDLMTAASDQCVRNYRGGLLYKNEIMKCGYPRNDLFFSEDRHRRRDTIRSKLGISDNELLVLYAPTYRYEQRSGENTENMQRKYTLPWDEVSEMLKERFVRVPRLAYRMHHITRKVLNLYNMYPDGIDLTDYPDMQELLLAADILITDYSSSMWDFSLQRKPVFLFYNDADEVEEEVGFYLYPDEYPYPKGHNTEELLQAIRDFDDAKYRRDLDEWFATYGTYDDGHASERVAERIIDVIEHPEKYGKA